MERSKGQDLKHVKCEWEEIIHLKIFDTRVILL